MYIEAIQGTLMIARLHQAIAEYTFMYCMGAYTHTHTHTHRMKGRPSCVSLSHSCGNLINGDPLLMAYSMSKKLLSVFPSQHDCRITESSRLEKTFRISKSNHKHDLPSPYGGINLTTPSSCCLCPSYRFITSRKHLLYNRAFKRAKT